MQQGMCRAGCRASGSGGRHRRAASSSAERGAAACLHPSPGSSSWGELPSPAHSSSSSASIIPARGTQLDLPENIRVFPRAAGAHTKLTVRKSLGKLLQKSIQSTQLLPGPAAFEVPLTGLVTNPPFFFSFLFSLFFNKEIKCKLPCHRIDGCWV